MDAYLEDALAPAEERTVSRDLFIAARDGYPLAATLYAPRVAAGGRELVIVNSAMAVPRRFYAPFARFLAAAGLHVLTYDYRGISGSRHEPVGKLRARLRDWGEKDFAATLAWAESELGDAAPRVVGHSVGGQIVGLAPNNARVERMLLVGAQSGDWRRVAGERVAARAPVLVRGPAADPGARLPSGQPPRRRGGPRRGRERVGALGQASRLRRRRPRRCARRGVRAHHGADAGLQLHRRPLRPAAGGRRPCRALPQRAGDPSAHPRRRPWALLDSVISGFFRAREGARLWDAARDWLAGRRAPAPPS